MIRRSGVIIRLATSSSAGVVGYYSSSPSPSPSPSRILQSLSSTSTTTTITQQQWRCNNGYLFDNRNLRSFHTYTPSRQLQQHHHYHLRQPHATVSAASYSSTTANTKDDSDNSKSEGGGIRGWMNDRQVRQEQEKYMEQMTRLSSMEVFTMEKYRDELSRGVDGGGMMTKISFLQTNEVKQAKEVVEVVEKMIEVVGPDATAEDLIQMDRLQRLRVATAANKTLEEISIMVSQITNMDVMQKTLRKRQLEGKPIPPDKDTMQAVIQKDALSVLSKPQKEMMKSRQEKIGRRMARKRR